MTDQHPKQALRLRDSDPDKFRTFGRAKGRPLSPAQSEVMERIYPRVAINPSKPLAGINRDAPIWFEIGFGGAEHLIWQAKANPDATLIGAEPFLNGIAKAVSAVDADDITNIRLHHGDARDVLDGLPDGSLDKVLVLFPDPWPKSKHHKRRLITPAFLDHVYRVLKPGGEFRFGSDIIHYVDWTLTRVDAHGGFSWHPSSVTDWRERGEDWPETRYLAKALREGRAGHFFRFIRDNKEPQDRG